MVSQALHGTSRINTYCIQSQEVSFQARLLSARIFFFLKVGPCLPPNLIAEPPATEVCGRLCLIGSPSPTQTPRKDHAQVTCSDLVRGQRRNELTLSPQQPTSRLLQNKNPLEALLHLHIAPLFLRERRHLPPDGRPRPRPDPDPRPHPAHPSPAPEGSRATPPKESLSLTAPKGWCRRSPQTPGWTGGCSSLAGSPRPDETPSSAPPTTLSLLGGRGDSRALRHDRCRAPDSRQPGPSTWTSRRSLSSLPTGVRSGQMPTQPIRAQGGWA